MQLKDIALQIGRSYKGLSAFVVNAGWSKSKNYTKKEEHLIRQGEMVE